MKLGTEGNHLLPSGRSDGVWGRNSQMKSSGMGQPGSRRARTAFPGRDNREVSSPPGPRTDPQRMGLQGQHGHLCKPRRLGQLPGQSGSFPISFPKCPYPAPEKPRSQGCLVSPPWAGTPTSPAFPLGQCSLLPVNIALHVLSSTCKGVSCVFSEDFQLSPGPR